MFDESIGIAWSRQMALCMLRLSSQPSEHGRVRVDVDAGATWRESITPAKILILV